MKSSLGLGVLLLLGSVACGDAAVDVATPDGGEPPEGGSLPDTGGTKDGSLPVVDSSTPPDASGGDGSVAPAHVKTVFLILMENHNWSSIKGSASAPYINKTLLPMAAHAESYFDNPKKVHPSEPNYIWLEAGDNLGITTDADPSASHLVVGKDHLVKQLKAAGVPWHAYVEDIPGGKCPIVSNGFYAVKHVPMAFFDDVVGSPPSTTAPECVANVVPYTQLATDLAANKVAGYNFITPNVCDDMHGQAGCGADLVKDGDTWLAAEVPKILASQAYKDDGALFITWDESEGGEFPIGMIVLSPLGKGGGYSNTTKYFHSSMVRTVETIFGIKTFLNDAANQPDLGDLFTTGL
ncbi:MAG TPA: alkaline phosphatase family protein [Polyangiaceae bacterium]